MDQVIIDFLLTRRSSKPALLSEPGPEANQLTTILLAAARVPDHKKLVPWRFIVFEGEARRRFGERLAEICQTGEGLNSSPGVPSEPSDIRLDTERGRLLRAPTVICVVSSPRTDVPVPEIEQILSAGAVCFNLCLAANALGFGTSWITEWYAFSDKVSQTLGLSKKERIAGFIYLGTESEKQPDRDRPQLEDIVTRWDG